MDLLKRFFAAGSAGNQQLTAMVGTVLLLLFTIEAATLLQLTSLLTVHAFVGMLLIPVVGLKLTSSGWRMLRYYFNGDEYVRRGPPHVISRAFIAPALVLSTLSLFATGVTLLALGRAGGTIVALHKASFIVWVGAAGIHVLTHVLRLPAMWRAKISGFPLRAALVTSALLAGVVLAMETLPAADQLQDRATASIGFAEDAR